MIRKYGLRVRTKPLVRLWCFWLRYTTLYYTGTREKHEIMSSSWISTSSTRVRKNTTSAYTTENFVSFYLRNLFFVLFSVIASMFCFFFCKCLLCRQTEWEDQREKHDILYDDKWLRTENKCVWGRFLLTLIGLRDSNAKFNFIRKPLVWQMPEWIERFWAFQRSVGCPLPISNAFDLFQFIDHSVSLHNFSIK